MARKTIDSEKIIKLLKEAQGVKTESEQNETEAPKGYSLIKAIREEKEYKSNVNRRDKKSRSILEKDNKTKNASVILPGQMIMFDYFEPKTKDELKYYDAQPVTIFFNVINTPLGRRVLGFNIHYYPPQVRWQIMDRIYVIFKPIYDKSWGKPLEKKIGGINYALLIEQLESQGLAFGVRMYDPSLMARITPIQFKDWSKAALTEGSFKKRTREAIMNYWSQAFGKKKKKKGKGRKPTKEGPKEK